MACVGVGKRARRVYHAFKPFHRLFQTHSTPIHRPLVFEWLRVILWADSRATSRLFNKAAIRVSLTIEKEGRLPPSVSQSPS